MRSIGKSIFCGEFVEDGCVYWQGRKKVAKATNRKRRSMLIRVVQKSDHDCTIAVMATVMGPTYDYQKVVNDQRRDPKASPDGLYLAWWEQYLWDEGFPNEYHKLGELNRFIRDGRIVGILNLAPVRGRIGHIVAIDEYGFINPSTGWPDRIPSLAQLLEDCRRSGASYVPDDEFLAVWRK